MPNRTAADEIRVIDLAFDAVRVDLPVEDIRHSRKIWNHVDEMRIDSDTLARLVRNGLRVGAASAEAWPAVSAILDAADAEIRRDQLVAQRGMPLSIHLGSIRQPESVFHYGRDDRLVGKTFPAGDKLLNVDYVYHPNLGGSTDLRLGFEIRFDRGVMTWERQNGVVRQVPAYDRHVFTDLSAVLTLNSGEFLVIGLSDQADNDYLIGSRFLTKKESGKRFETLLFLTPRPYESQGAEP